MLSLLNQSENITITVYKYNETAGDCDTGDLQTLFWYWFFADVFCSLLSIAGNFLVIFIVFCDPKLRTTLNFLFVNMSLSDALIPSLDLLGVIFIYLGIGGNLDRTSELFLCKLLPFFLNVSAAVSVQTLVLIAIHRFYAVVFPMKARLSKGKMWNFAVIFANWLVAVAIFGPYLYFYKAINEYGLINCFLSLKGIGLQVYDIFVSVLLRTLPFLVMATMYTTIVFKMKRQPVPGNPSPLLTKRRKQNMKLTYMCITLLLVFFCCWGIYEILYMISLYGSYRYQCVINKALNIFYPFSSVNSAINPLIYFIFCGNFRHALKKMFRNCFLACTKEASIAGHEIIEL